MYNTRESIRQTINEALKLISNMVGSGYRPQSLIAGFMDAQNQRLLASDEGIHVCQGQIWSQHAIDNGDGDGGIPTGVAPYGRGVCLSHAAPHPSESKHLGCDRS